MNHVDTLGGVRGTKCSWRIHASIMPDGVTYQVRTIKGKHYCKRLLDNPAATCSWIARMLFHDVNAKPNISVASMSKILMRKSNLLKKHNTIWRAKVKILRLIKGNHKDGFNLLARYTEMIKSSNSGSICYIKWHDPVKEGARPIFSRMFVSFNAWKEVFLGGCRKFIGADGSHPKCV